MIPVDPERIDELLEQARSVRVLVVGDLMVDRYISGRVERVSPEAPVPVVRVLGERAAIGGAGNVAANVTALGASCRVVGCAGTDAEGELLLAALSQCGVPAEGIARTQDRPTTVKTRVLAKHQQIVRFDREVDDEMTPTLAERLAETVEDLARECDVLVVQDYNKGTLAPQVIRAVLDASITGDVPSVVDPKRRNFFAYPGVTVFKPNARELGDALGDFIHPDDAGWMEDTRRRLGCHHLLLTLGGEGMALQTREGRHARLPTIAQGVYDVSGAGDTVTAAVAVAIAAGAAIHEAAVLANHAAALEVAKPGVQTVSPAEVKSHVRSHPDA